MGRSGPSKKSGGIGPSFRRKQWVHPTPPLSEIKFSFLQEAILVQEWSLAGRRVSRAMLGSNRGLHSC